MVTLIIIAGDSKLETVDLLMWTAYSLDTDLFIDSMYMWEGQRAYPDYYDNNIYKCSTRSACPYCESGQSE